ncbi:hypothetical protein [Fuchsiella alkaliacetigena]|nr:hypothetical protein [Fuchsiella alkaliacetigena]
MAYIVLLGIILAAVVFLRRDQAKLEVKEINLEGVEFKNEEEKLL